MNAILKWSLVIGIVLEMVGSGVVIASTATYTPIEESSSPEDMARHVDAELKRNRDMARIGAGVLTVGLVITAARLVVDAAADS